MSSVKPLPLPPYSRGPKWPVILFGILLLLIFIGGGYYAYLTYFHTQPADQQEEVIESDDVVSKVRELMELPEEEPTIATVSDVTQLRDQEFFSRAQNGDKVLIFQEAGKAILFRPSTGKIIEVGPVTIELPTQTATGSGQIESPLSVVLYNGSTTVGITQEVEERITSSQESVEVLERENAEGTYEDSLVVDLTGRRAADAQILADLLGGIVSELPDTEASPEAEILIIVGNSYE